MAAVAVAVVSPAKVCHTKGICPGACQLVSYYQTCCNIELDLELNLELDSDLCILRTQSWRHAHDV